MRTPERAPAATGSVGRLQRLLLARHRSEARSLPWRDTRDPYRILVSETMLQQTQVARVEPVFRSFVERFPDVRVLAAATPAEVLTAWAGLGYNRRAINLHAAARVITAEHDGRVPDHLPELVALPGIGSYTARAVLAFAYGRDVAPVDTNVARVLARSVAGRPLARGELQQLADRLVPPGEAGAWAGALMDLGADVCQSRRPRCDACPVADACAWRASGSLVEDPARATAIRSRPQARFDGSDRYHRGRLVDALRGGPVGRDGIADAAGLSDDPARAARLASTLVGDGLAEWLEGELRLPMGSGSAV